MLFWFFDKFGYRMSMQVIGLDGSMISLEALGDVFCHVLSACRCMFIVASCLSYFLSLHYVTLLCELWLRSPNHKWEKKRIFCWEGSPQYVGLDRSKCSDLKWNFSTERWRFSWWVVGGRKVLWADLEEAGLTLKVEDRWKRRAVQHVPEIYV